MMHIIAVLLILVGGVLAFIQYSGGIDTNVTTTKANGPTKSVIEVMPPELLVATGAAVEPACLADCQRDCGQDADCTKECQDVCSASQ